MTAKQLTDSILQLAIQGKLVPQNPDDEPASVLLDRIREEKKRLVKEGKLKKKDIEETPISDDEIPFDIPESWEWVRINDYSSKVTDFVASGSFASLRENVKYYSNKEHAILVRTKDFQTNFQSDLVYTDKHGYDFLSNSNLYGGELILPNIGASIGKVFIVPKLDYPMTLAPNTVMVRFYFDEQRDWIYSLFSSNFGKKLLYDISSSTAQGKFNKTDFKKLVIPIPPLAEQKRIAKRLEEVLPSVNQLGAAYEELEKMNSELPEKLKKSILQEAIMGKLGTQDPNDEPASVLLDRIREEKKQLVKAGVLKKKDLVETPISDDEIPFELPENWELVKLAHIGYFMSGQTPKSDDLSSSGSIPYFKVSDMNVIGNEYCMNNASLFLKEGTKYKLFPKNSIIYPKNGGALLTNKKRVLIKNSLVDLNTGAYVPSQELYFNYVYFLFSIIDFRKHSKGTALPTVDMDSINSIRLPLPPLAEQHRIVEKIEALFAEVDHIEI